MFSIIWGMFVGIVVGRLLRRHKMSWLGKTINVLIWILLFLLGIEAGSDDRIIDGISTLGGEAIAIAVAGITGSALLAYALWKWATGNKSTPDNGSTPHKAPNAKSTTHAEKGDSDR